MFSRDIDGIILEGHSGKGTTKLVCLMSVSFSDSSGSVDSARGAQCQV